MLPNTDATDLDRSIICGHYIFGSDEFLDLKSEITTIAKKKRQSLMSFSNKKSETV